MDSVDRPWITVGAVVAVTYVVSLAFWGFWATQGGAFTAAAVGIVVGAAIGSPRGWAGPSVKYRTRCRTRTLATDSDTARDAH